MNPAYPTFPLPQNKNQKLWRYMDLSKFLALLQTRELWFSRADKLGDPLEGSVTRAQRKAEDINRDARKTLSRFRKNNLKNFFVSCWHANDQESAAMWRLYSQSSESICIQTTLEKLTTLLPDEILVGNVSYLDYDTDEFPSLNLLGPIMHKRKSFAHEQEFRLVAWTLAELEGSDAIRKRANSSGLGIPLPPEEYIERIYINPIAPEWFRLIVARLSSDYNLPATVQQSSLLRNPIY